MQWLGGTIIVTPILTLLTGGIVLAGMGVASGLAGALITVGVLEAIVWLVLLFGIAPAALNADVM